MWPFSRNKGEKKVEESYNLAQIKLIESDIVKIYAKIETIDGRLRSLAGYTYKRKHLFDDEKEKSPENDKTLNEEELNQLGIRHMIIPGMK